MRHRNLTAEELAARLRPYEMGETRIIDLRPPSPYCACGAVIDIPGDRCSFCDRELGSE